jgi:hypothetical protein
MNIFAYLVVVYVYNSSILLHYLSSLKTSINIENGGPFDDIVMSTHIHRLFIDPTSTISIRMGCPTHPQIYRLVVLVVLVVLVRQGRTRQTKIPFVISLTHNSIVCYSFFLKKLFFITIIII